MDVWFVDAGTGYKGGMPTPEESKIIKYYALFFTISVAADVNKSWTLALSSRSLASIRYDLGYLRSESTKPFLGNMESKSIGAH
jgi:hypothetical protein